MAKMSGNMVARYCLLGTAGHMTIVAIEICDRIWENPLYGIFFQKIEFDAWLISSTIELTRVSSLRPIVCLVVEIQCFVCDCATCTPNNREITV